jgi:parvulin-like peptidyl-prolyl isomerase
MRAMEARDKLREGADFDEIVKEYSEEAGAVSRGGSIGTVERADVAKPFADAAFELSINQMSDVVETEFGFHLILRTE